MIRLGDQSIANGRSSCMELRQIGRLCMQVARISMPHALLSNPEGDDLSASSLESLLNNKNGKVGK